MSDKFYYYQKEANDAICKELVLNDKCLVKMFCGTGKSMIMRYCDIIQNKNLVVYVFPSLALIEQFYKKYLNDFNPNNILKISSEHDRESTTDVTNITNFLLKKDKIICVTYKSYDTLLSCLDNRIIDIVIYDEAHHIVGPETQKLIFQTSYCIKQIFLTATPKNHNNIFMHDVKDLGNNMCGKLVYDYSYLRGVNEGYLNPFEIRIEMFTENTNKSMYENISRAIIESGNSRVLTFHSDVNTNRDLSVKNFVNEKQFINIFNYILETEFPEKINYYQKVSFVGLYSDISSDQRKEILIDFDDTLDNEVMILSSCETIGEGVDTKNANMCVFADPKSSIVKIIQNIGRIVRKNIEIDKPKSTILIPCWVDKNKYLECNGDKHKCDQIIREDISERGNFNGILNVLSALKQEDEDLYEICLYYPDTFSPKELNNNLNKQGYFIGNVIGDGYLIETISHLLDIENNNEDYKDYKTDQEILTRIAKDNDINIEVHTNSLESPIEEYKSDSENESGEVIRIYKSLDKQTEKIIYQPIIKNIGTKRNSDKIYGLKKENRLQIKVHANSDIEVLWNIKEYDLTKDICSCIIDCEVLSNHEKWFQNFEELKLFINENKRTPNSNLKDNKYESKLGEWFYHQKQYYRKKTHIMTDETRYKLWSNFLEEYAEYFISKEEDWFQKFEELKDFINKNKRKPLHENEDENILSDWLQTHNTLYNNKLKGMKNEKRYNLWTEFLEEYAEYIVSKEEDWIKKFEKLKDFINKNKRKPLAKDDKQLEKWLSHQQSNYRTKTEGMKNEKRYNLWTEFLEEYAEYIVSKEEDWIKKLQDLKIFINKNRRKPSRGKTDENPMGNWLASQLRNYNNKTEGMKDEKRYNLWCEFLEEYKQYFDKNTSTKLKDNEEKNIKPKQKKSAKLPAQKKNKEKEIIHMETQEDKKNITKSEITKYHNKFCKMNSENLAKYFQENPQEFEKYHLIRDETLKTFREEDMPHNIVISELDKIKVKRPKQTVDMGCGTAKIAEHFKNDKRFNFINYDHVAINENIKVCNINNMPLEDDSVEICIMSLSLWGPNCEKNIQEAYRVLETNGILYIIDSTKRWSIEDEYQNIIVGKEGSKLRQLLENNNFQITSENINKWCFFKCVCIK